MKRKSGRASTGHGTGVLQRAPLSQMLQPFGQQHLGAVATKRRPRRGLMRRLLRKHEEDVTQEQQPAPVGDFKPVKVI